MKVEPAIINHLKSELSGMASRLMSYHKHYLPAQDMFLALMPDQSTYHVMLNAINLLPNMKCPTWSFNTQRIKLGVDANPGNAPPFDAYLAEFDVEFPETKWVLPENLTVLTPQSTLGKALIPMIEIADDLANLNHVFDAVCMYMPYSNVLSNVFPWVKDIVRDVKYREDFHRISWMQHNGVRRSEGGHARIINQFHALEFATGFQSMPSLTKEINRVCRSGALAMTQYRILKGSPEPKAPQGYASITPRHNANDASERVKNEMQLVRDYYNGSKDI